MKAAEPWWAVCHFYNRERFTAFPLLAAMYSCLVGTPVIYLP